MMKNIEEAYNRLPTLTKEDITFPDNFINLTREQEQFIIELYFTDIESEKTDRESVKKELLQSIEEMKEIINDI